MATVKQQRRSPWMVANLRLDDFISARTILATDITKAAAGAHAGHHH